MSRWPKNSKDLNVQECGTKRASTPPSSLSQSIFQSPTEWCDGLRRKLTSANGAWLVLPQPDDYHLVITWRLSFLLVALVLENALPTEMQLASLVLTFCWFVKTCLFRQAFSLI